MDFGDLTPEVERAMRAEQRLMRVKPLSGSTIIMIAITGAAIHFALFFAGIACLAGD